MFNLNQLNEDNTRARFISNSIYFRISTFFLNNTDAERFIRYLSDDFVVFGSILFDRHNTNANDLDIMINDHNNRSKAKILRFITFLFANGYELIKTSDMYGTMLGVQVSKFKNLQINKSIDLVFISETPVYYLKKNVDFQICSGVFNGMFIETASFIKEDDIIISPIYGDTEDLDIDKMKNDFNIERLAKYLQKGFYFTYQGEYIPQFTRGEYEQLYEYIQDLKYKKQLRSQENTGEC